MNELRLRRVFLGLVNGSLLLNAAGCGGATGQEPVADPADSKRNSTATAGSGGFGSTTGIGGSGGIGGSAGIVGSAGEGGIGGTTSTGTGDILIGDTGTGIGGTTGRVSPMAEPFWPDLELAEFATPTCGPEGWRATDGLHPQSSVDSISLREKWDAQTSRELDSTGTACATASDVPACEQAIIQVEAGVEANESCGGPPFACQHYLLTTAGDHVQAWTLTSDLLSFVGPIDTPQEALLRVYQGTFMGYQISCDDPESSSVRSSGDGYDVVVLRMVADCSPIVTERHLLHVAADGSVSMLRSQVAHVSTGCVGRRPEGLVARASEGHTQQVLGEFFAGISHLEAASVTAFERLELELAALGAPAALREEARRAARDELRHAAQTRSVAEGFGGQVAAPIVEALAARDLERVACENVAEGCVRETYGALVAHHQARHARHPEIQHMMLSIAEDETRHAALAWRVAAWADAQLSSQGRERVRAARERALAQLRSELSTQVPEELCRVAGVPSAAAALELFAGLERELWQWGEPSAVGVS